MNTDPQAPLTEADLEFLGQTVDRLENFAAGAVIPIPAEIHKQVLAEGMADIGKQLKDWLVGKGFNPWTA